jgi:hypothetical protein
VTSRDPAKIYEAFFGASRSLDSWMSIKFNMVLFMYIIPASFALAK